MSEKTVNNIDDAMIDYLEDLSCLSLSTEEKKLLKDELPKITGSMARLAELDTEGIDECSNPLDDTNSFRNDEAAPSFGRDLILLNVPKKNDEMIIVPKTVD